MLGKHLLGIYEKALDPRDDWDQRLEKAKALGFDYVEISIDEADMRLERLYWSEKQIEQLRRSCYEAGIGINSMCLSGHRRFPFGSADPKTREKAKDIMLRAIDFAAAMGIRVIQLAGYDVYYEPSTQQSAERFLDSIQWAACAAAQKQVMLAMEIMDVPFMNSITKNAVYEAYIRSPWYRVYPDLGNLTAWPENDVSHELSLGIGGIVAIHLKDTLPVTDSFPGKFKCVPFGSGCVDFSRDFALLESLNYCGPYMIEMWYADGTDDMQEVAKAKSWLEARFEEGMRLLPSYPQKNS